MGWAMVMSRREIRFINLQRLSREQRHLEPALPCLRCADLQQSAEKHICPRRNETRHAIITITSPCGSGDRDRLLGQARGWKRKPAACHPPTIQDRRPSTVLGGCRSELMTFFRCCSITHIVWCLQGSECGPCRGHFQLAPS